jgi:sugar lactone lactonase YvrE
MNRFTLTRYARKAGLLFAMTAALMAAGCGGGGGAAATPDGTLAPTPTPTIPTPTPTVPAPTPTIPTPTATATAQLSLLAGALGGRGFADGTGEQARLGSGYAMEYDSAGNLIVADGNNGRLRSITPAGVVTTLATFFPAYDMTRTSDGGYLLGGFNRIVRTDASGSETLSIGARSGSGGADGPIASATLASPRGMVQASDGTIYFSSLVGHTVRKVTPAGQVVTLAGTHNTPGNVDAIGAAARFNEPYGLALDTAQTQLFVADSRNHRIRVIDLATNTVSHYAGSTSGTPVSEGADGTLLSASFFSPQAMRRMANDDSLWVADSDTGRIRRISATGDVTTVVGPAAGTPRGTATTGPVTTLGLRELLGFAVSASGEIALSDTFREEVFVVRSGMVSSLAGKSASYGSADGAGASARFGRIDAIDVQANIVTAFTVEPEAIRLVNEGVVSTVATTGILNLNAISRAADGSLYGVDFYGISRLRSDGSVERIAGSSVLETGTADGAALSARFNGVAQIVTLGNVQYLTEYRSDRIRKLEAGTVSTIAGQLGVNGSTNGTGAGASFSNINDMIADGAGNLMVADGGALRRITPAGVVTTVLTSDQFNCYGSIALASNGDVYCGAGDTITRTSLGGISTTVIEASAARALVPGAVGAGAQLNSIRKMRLLSETATEIRFVVSDVYEAALMVLTITK